MRWRLAQGQHRCHAGVAPFELASPFVARAGDQFSGDRVSHLRPQARVVLALDEALVQAKGLRELGKELRLERTHGDVLAVGGGIGAVKRCAAVEQVGAALVVVPAACGQQAVKDRQQRRRAVDHRGVDHLAAARALALEQRGHQTERQVQRAAAVVADQIQRRHRLAVGWADRVQRTGQRDVVDVVAGGLRQRPALPVARHAPVDQLGVARGAFVGADAESLGHARTPAFDQHVGGVDQPQHGVTPSRLLEVQRNRSAAAAGDVETRIERHAESARLDAVDADHVGTLVGQQHRAHRSGADAGQLDHAQSGEWAAHAVSVPESGVRLQRAGLWLSRLRPLRAASAPAGRAR